ADRDLRRDSRYRVARRLRRECGGARDPRVDFDHPVLAGPWVDGELDVATSLDAEGPNDTEGGGAQHLVVRVAQGLGRGHDDRFARVDPHRVQVLHIADCDAIVRGVPHDLVFELLPAYDGLLHTDL